MGRRNTPANHDPGIFPDPVGQLERVVGPVLEDNAAPRGAAGVGAGAVQRQTVMDADPAGLRLDRRDAAGAVFPYLGLATAAAEQAIFAYVSSRPNFERAANHMYKAIVFGGVIKHYHHRDQVGCW